MKAMFVSGLTVMVYVSLGLTQTSVLDKASKSTITFKGFGIFSTEESTTTSPEIKRTDSMNNFKGQGIAGKLVGKLFAKPANAGEIINLPESKIYEWDLKKKKCSIRPIESIVDTVAKATGAKQSVDEKKAAAKEEKSAESSIEIIKSEFKVEKTGKSGTVNNFAFDEYWINAYALWRDKETGMIGCDSLSVLSSMTPLSENIKSGMEIETAFARGYLEKVGINVGKSEEDLLGGKWLQMLQQMKPGNSAADARHENMGAEMAKLDGLYPVVVDGKYYARRSGGEQQTAADEQPEEESTDVRKGLGGLAKGLLGKKQEEKPQGLQPAMMFFTEVLKLNVGAGDASRFTSPLTCK